jgi:AcrR family transcriptional regulator
MPESFQKWLEKGYELFAKDGPDGFQIEKLARDLSLNKSGFYHNFGDRELFFYELVKYHSQVNAQFCEEIKLSKNFDPDFLKLAIKYKTAILAQMQFRKHSYNQLFKKAFEITRNHNKRFIIPLWADYLNISDNQPLASELFELFRDVFFMHISFENHAYELSKNIASRFSLIVNALKRPEKLIGFDQPISC